MHRETVVDRGDGFRRQVQVRFRRLQRHACLFEQRDQAFNRVLLIESRIETRVGDDVPLCSDAHADALRHACQERCQRRPHRLVEDPDRLRAQLAQHLREPRELKHTRKLAPAMLEIERPRNTTFGLQQFRSLARRGREERDRVLGSCGRNRANERQMPDHVADAALGLNDGGGSHANPRCHAPRMRGIR